MRLTHVLFMAILLLPCIAFASNEKLSLNQAIIKVLEGNPVLKATDYESRAAAARIRAARQTPALNASLELENFAGSGVYEGSDSLETTLSLSKVIELGNQPELRGELADHEAVLLGSEQDAKRLDLLSDTVSRFIHVLTDQHRLAIAKNSLNLAEQTLRIVKRRVKAGRTPEAELRRAQNRLARHELELEHAEHELQTTRLKLAVMWGETKATYTEVNADLFKVQSAVPFNQLADLLEQNPELVRFATENRLAKTRIELARARGSSNFEFKAGVRHYNATDDTGFVLSMNMPFGTNSRAEAYIEEAEAMALRDPHLQEQRRLKLYATLFEVHQEIKHAIEAVTKLRKVIIPNAEYALKEYEKGYSLGRYSFIELTEAQNVLLESRLEAVNAAEKYHTLRAEIDRLTGARQARVTTP